jgi:hypothetical protein
VERRVRRVFRFPAVGLLVCARWLALDFYSP